MRRAPVSLASALAALLALCAADHARADDGAVARGGRIAALGNGRGAVACASCHAFNGGADPNAAFPRLAGQSAAYLGSALKAFADGHRRNALMTPIAKALSEAERADVAAYFASVAAPFPPSPEADPAQVELGRVIANVGLNDQQIPACVACHGPYGRSVNPQIPSLAGQYGRYIAFELRMFRDGYRKSEAMVGLAKALTDAQVEALAAYFQRAPGPTGPGMGIAQPIAAAQAGTVGAPMGAR